ncbi:hypothetical protein LCGC14_2292520, partial [marine sediment metagenome]
VYSGSKDLTFSGPSTALSGTVPTVEATDVGSATSVIFTAGVSDTNAAALTAYMAETTTVDVSQGSINSFGDVSYDLDLTVNPGAANNLAYSVQPTNTISAVSISPAIIVQVRDQWDNVLISDNSTSVAIAIDNNPGSGTLSGTTSQTAVSGEATFNDLSINKSGTGYTFTVTSGSLTAATSDGFNITPAAASYFKVTGTASMTAGSTNELTITAYDQYDNVATGYSGSKDLTFSGPSTAPSGTVPTVEATDVGSATSLNFTSGVSGSPLVTLVAYKAETTTVDVSQGSINSTGDETYDLGLTVNPGAANNLAYSQQPTNTVTGSAITPAVAVQVRDQWDNVLTSDSSTSVGIAINTNPPGDGTLSGTTSQTAVSGEATFNDLSIDKIGDGYTLDATSGGLTTATSSGFNITLPTIQFTSASSSGAESATPVTLQLTLSAVSGLDVSVDYALSGTATGSGTDYTLAVGTATINAGNTTTNISATIVDDLLDEANETIVVTISNPTNATLGTNTVHTYTINDNDASPTIQFTSTSSSGAESTTPVTLQLTLSAVSGLDVSVDYAVTGGAATGSGTDYTLTAG